MPITKADVEQTAKLAKLNLTDAEKETLTRQLGEIVNYVEKINELDLDGVPPTSHVLDLENVMREDEIKPWMNQDEALANAPAKYKGFFSVPKVILQQ